MTDLFDRTQQLIAIRKRQIAKKKQALRNAKTQTQKEIAQESIKCWQKDISMLESGDYGRFCSPEVREGMFAQIETFAFIRKHAR